MKLISDIINELVDINTPINSSLLKTKVLASRLSNQELITWVNYELEGYQNADNLPKYRIYMSTTIGDYISGHNHFKDQIIPTAGLNEDLEDFMKTMKFQQSIEGLENLLKDNKSGTLEFKFPAEVVGLVQNNLKKYNTNNKYIQLMTVRNSVSINAVQEILACVRNKLLNFMLEVEGEFGNITEIAELKTKKEQILHIMNQTIITGDGNILNTGDNSSISAKIQIKKGNKEELKSFFEENGVSNQDTSELLNIIDDEIPNSTNNTFGMKVNNWIQKMMSKALDGSWEISLGAAGSLLADGLKVYYGIE